MVRSIAALDKRPDPLSPSPKRVMREKRIDHCKVVIMGMRDEHATVVGAQGPPQRVPRSAGLRHSAPPSGLIPRQPVLSTVYADDYVNVPHNSSWSTAMRK